MFRAYIPILCGNFWANIGSFKWPHKSKWNTSWGPHLYCPLFFFWASPGLRYKINLWLSCKIKIIWDDWNFMVTIVTDTMQEPYSLHGTHVISKGTKSFLLYNKLNLWKFKLQNSLCVCICNILFYDFVLIQLILHTHYIWNPLK